MLLCWRWLRLYHQIGAEKQFNCGIYFNSLVYTIAIISAYQDLVKTKEDERVEA